MSTRTRHKSRFNLMILRRVSAGVLISLLIPLVLLGIVYGQMSARIRDQYYERNMTHMQSSLHSLEMLFDNMDQIAVYLGDHNEIASFYNIDRPAIRKNLTVFLKAQQTLGSISVANSDVENIQLYSAHSGTLMDLNTVSLYPERYYGTDFLLEGYDYETFRTEYLLGDRFLGFSRRTVSGTRFHGSEEAVIYQIRHVGSNMRSRNNRALFYLTANHLLSLFDSLDHFEDSSFYLMNEKGEILLRHGGEDIPEESAADVLRLNSHEEANGYYNIKAGGADCSVIYCRSGSRGLVSAAVLPYSLILSAVSTFRVSMMILLVVALLAGTALLILHGIRLATPAFEVAGIFQTETDKTDVSQIAGKVRELARSNEKMREKISRQVSAVKAEAFIRLLTGEDLGEEEKLNTLESLGIRKDADRYMILLINANDIRIDTDLNDLVMQRVLLDNLLKEQETPEISSLFPVDIERSVLCLTADGLSMRDFQRTAEEMVSYVRRSLLDAGGDISYSIGGDIVDSAAGLPQAFLHAQLALKIPQNIFGSHAIQWYERARQYAGPGSVSQGAQEDVISAQNRILIENVKKYIREHYSNPQLSLSLVGEEFYITEVYLSKLFKKATGENFSRYVESVRMKRARELLDEGQKVMDVVPQVGYNSPQVFRRAWKRYYQEENSGET